MNRILKKFLQRGVDLSPVGVELREDNTNYFCTPKGASVFGWAGIDGIHFCFIRGFGEMVFSVSPMNTSPDYVHPVAENFTDFLRLILACGDVAAVEQAWMWNEAQFEAFLNENPTTQEQQQTLSEISEKMNLLPMEQPWTYIKNLQSSFDYSQIKYTEDYYDNDMTSEAELVAPEWKVYFDGDFWGHRGKDRAGKEIKLDKQFDWAGYHWVIPAAYSCSKGLVVDFCMRVDSESIRDFMKKWNLDWENDSCENFTREQQMQMEWENPLCFNFKPCLKLNEKILQTTHGCAVSFNPCLPDGVINELEAKWAIDHYGLDSTYGWVICRDVFPWGTKHHPEINKLFLTMEQQPGQVPGSHFKVHAPGDSFMFSHPVSGITHTLTVQEIEQQTVPQNSFGSDRWIYPTHYIAMSYTLTPEPMENISVFDCDEGDRPIEVTPDDHSFRPVGSSSCFVVGVIGGADGPTAVIYGTNSQEKLHAACSALHFEPVGDDVEWRIVFNVTQFDKETLILTEQLLAKNHAETPRNFSGTSEEIRNRILSNYEPLAVNALFTGLVDLSPEHCKVNYYYWETLASADFRDIFKTISVPCGLLYADPGSGYQPDTAKYMQEQIQTSVEMLAVENSSHMASADNPKQFIEHITHFVTH